MVGFVTPTRGGRMVGANKSTIAQWIRLCLPSCCPGFNSQARHLCFYHNSQICAIFVHAMWEKNENKQREAEIGPFFKKNLLSYGGNTKFVVYKHCFSHISTRYTIHHSWQYFPYLPTYLLTYLPTYLHTSLSMGNMWLTIDTGKHP